MGASVHSLDVQPHGYHIYIYVYVTNLVAGWGTQFPTDLLQDPLLSSVWQRWCVKDVCERWCVTKMCVKDGVWQSCVCQRWCVTKMCVKDGVWQRCVWKMVCDKVVCDKDGVWQRCVWKMVCVKGLLWITDGRANSLMDRKVVGAVFFGMVAIVAVVTSPQLLDVVWCSAVVLVL